MVNIPEEYNYIYIPPDTYDISLRTPSIHSNFTIIDDFSQYETAMEAVEAGWSWALSGASFGKTFSEPLNFFDRHGISIWVKSNYDVCFYLALEDSYGVKSNFVKLGFLPKRWKRLDCPIITEEDSNIDFTAINKFLIRYDAEPDAEFYIGEIIAFGFDDYNKNKQWTPLMITKAETSKIGRTTISEVAGGYGDIIHQDKAYSLRGSITFKTSHVEMDNDIRFIDKSRRKQTKLFLRMGGEGWPVYVTDYKQTPEENIYGVRSEMTLKFIEAE